MASRSVAQSESIAAFIPALELLITEAMDEWKIPGLTVAVVQNGEVALVRAYGLRDADGGGQSRPQPSAEGRPLPVVETDIALASRHVGV
jgi:CubicO group peptidase (beta-lactamase class C family)